MTVKVASRLRQALSDTVLGSSLAGDGLLVRLRSTSIAILAVVAVVGLGLVAFISQLGWPSVLSGPIPQGPARGVIHNDPIALARKAPQPAAPASSARPDSDALGESGISSPAVLIPESVPPPVAAPPAGAGPPGGSPPSHPSPSPAGKSPEPSAPAEPAPAEPAPPEGEAPGPSHAAVVEEESPGKSGEAPGHVGGTGPPPWAHSGDRHPSGHESPGRPDRD
jgi:hypothetical protein